MSLGPWRPCWQCGPHVERLDAVIDEARADSAALRARVEASERARPYLEDVRTAFEEGRPVLARKFLDYALVLIPGEDEGPPPATTEELLARVEQFRKDNPHPPDRVAEVRGERDAALSRLAAAEALLGRWVEYGHGGPEGKTADDTRTFLARGEGT